MALLRGFSKIPNYPNISDKYKMKCAAIAAYPMYKGLAKLIGMSVLDAGNSFESEIQTLHSNYDISLFDFVQDIFQTYKIEYFYEKDLGDKFNFASPTTQFYITHD